MEWCSPLHFGIVAIEKGAFRLPSTTVTYFTSNLLAKSKLPKLVCYRFSDQINIF